MNSDQFERWLRRQGIVVETKKGTGHKVLRNPSNNRKSVLPVHGGRKQLGTGLINRILRDLGLK